MFQDKRFRLTVCASFRNLRFGFQFNICFRINFCFRMIIFAFCNLMFSCAALFNISYLATLKKKNFDNNFGNNFLKLFLRDIITELYGLVKSGHINVSSRHFLDKYQNTDINGRYSLDKY